MDARVSTLGGSESAGSRESQSSGALLQRAREGDDGARTELYARYFPRLRQWAHDRLPAWAHGRLDTDGIVQDTLLEFVRRLDGGEPQHDRAFCASVCDALRDRLQEAIRQVVTPPPGAPSYPESAADHPSPLERAVGRDSLREYESAVQRLKESDRELVIERVELNLDYDEIAELHGMPSSVAARVAVGRALLRLCAEMEHERKS